MSTANVGANPHVNAGAQGSSFSFNGKDSLIGLLVGSFLNSPIIGAGVGGFIRNLFTPNAGDMDAAHDPQRATQGAQTFDFGDLKGMADGLFGNIRDAFAGGPQAHQQAQANGEFSNQPPPETHEEAMNTGRPAQGPEVEAQAQQQSGFKWGKVLKWGGIALAGLTLMNSLPMMMGGFGMPFFGGGMMNPMMMGGMFPGFTF